MIYGYHRVSTAEQHLDRGVAEIEAYCKGNNLQLEKIFCDKQTGKNFSRPRYTVLKDDVLRTGDTLIITELDRLGRSKKDTMQEIQHFQECGVRLMVLELPTTLMDMSKMDNKLASLMLETINNLMLELYASMAEAELEKKQKRQREGIEQMKARGEWARYGRPAAISYDSFAARYIEVVRGEKRPFELMRELGLSKSVFYRLKKEFEKKQGE